MRTKKTRPIGSLACGLSWLVASSAFNQRMISGCAFNAAHVVETSAPGSGRRKRSGQRFTRWPRAGFCSLKFGDSYWRVKTDERCLVSQRDDSTLLHSMMCLLFAAHWAKTSQQLFWKKHMVSINTKWKQPVFPQPRQVVGFLWFSLIAPSKGSRDDRTSSNFDSQQTMDHAHSLRTMPTLWGTHFMGEKSMLLLLCDQGIAVCRVGNTTNWLAR